MKKLSIIVPMYNVEPYVERCIRSVEDQDIPKEDYEVICVNDGSPDNSKGVVLKLQKEFNNIIIIDQENQGVSRARNNAMDIAKGQYLLMVDPDDYLKPNILKERIRIITKYNIEVGLFSFIILDKDLNEEYRYDPEYDPNKIISGIDFFNEYRKNSLDIIERDPHRSWAIFFERKFMNTNSLRYLSDVPYLEDGELMARILCQAKRVVFLNGPAYMRTTRSGSATHSRLYYSEKGRSGFLKAANNLYQFKLSVCKQEEEKIFINQHIVQFTLVSVISMGGLNYFKNYFKNYRVLKKGPLRKIDTDGCSDFYKKMGNYYNRSIHWFYLHWLIYLLGKSIKIRLKKLI